MEELKTALIELTHSEVDLQLLAALYTNAIVIAQSLFI
jgi:hypothetical protein